MVAAHGLDSCGSQALEYRLYSCGLSHSAACGIFPDHGSNPCVFHWQADCSTLSQQGNPRCRTFFLSPHSTAVIENLSSGIITLPSLLACDNQFSSVQSLSLVQLFTTPWIAARQASLSITNSRSLLKLMPIESVMPSSHLILCCPLLLLPPIPPSIRVFSNEKTLRMRWPKYWSFSFNISCSNEYSGLIAFRMDLLGLLAGQGTLNSSPAPHFKNFLYSPTLTSIHEY